ncbi:calcium-binding protein [Nocardiopsis sp. TSRI0078]|uniref:calcium-binding protein n=1 Tax=unclassified Nocardiopsis TaxID=2649073 RepID=UPI00093B010F|nr:calcium-binding protein [Nocardiopsis sp. TSRI0078]OKI22010.1 calcium-binding protein [Nocardiopsis sp. TSRI0078]
MTHAQHSRDEQAEEQDRSPGRQRGGSPSAIAGALHRTPHPGPQHWGGPRPRKMEPDPFFPRRLGPPPEHRGS